MPRNLTPRGLRGVQDEVEGAVFLPLLTITIPAPPAGGSETIFRVVPNTEPIVSRGLTFEPCAFEFVMPEDALDRTPDCELRIDNVDLAMIDALRAVADPPSIKVEGVWSDVPDFVELTIENYLLRNVQWDVQTITGTVQANDVFSLAFPSRYPTYDPIQFPGLFA